MYICLVGFAVVVQVISLDEYTITRNDTDQFKFPSTLTVCSSSLNDKCLGMGGNVLQDADGCPCQCREMRNTFGYYKGTWKCEDNAEVRKHSSMYVFIELKII